MGKFRDLLDDLNSAGTDVRAELTLTELQLILGYLVEIDDTDPVLQNLITTLEEIIETN